MCYRKWSFQLVWLVVIIASIEVLVSSLSFFPDDLYSVRFSFHSYGNTHVQKPYTAQNWT